MENILYINDEYPLGKGEVECSIHSGSTTEADKSMASYTAEEFHSAVTGRTEPKHDVQTRGELVDSVPPMFFGSKRPKIWLRRCQDEAGLLAIRTFILNRGKEGEAIALKNLRHALSP